MSTTARLASILPNRTGVRAVQHVPDSASVGLRAGRPPHNAPREESHHFFGPSHSDNTIPMLIDMGFHKYGCSATSVKVCHATPDGHYILLSQDTASNAMVTMWLLPTPLKPSMRGRLHSFRVEHNSVCMHACCTLHLPCARHRSKHMVRTVTMCRTLLSNDCSNQQMSASTISSKQIANRKDSPKIYSQGGTCQWFCISSIATACRCSM